MENVSSILMFTLAQLDETMESRYMLLSLTALCYHFILLCNITIIVCIASDKGLHEPMYIFLCNLCVNSLYGTAGFYPKFMYDLLSQIPSISYSGCMFQIFVIYSSVLCDCSILTVMAYDRYVAICRPLEYYSEMTNIKIVKCIIFCWLAPLSSMGILVLLTSRLTLCGSNIGKPYCENWAVVKLACYSITVNNVIGYVVIIIYLGHAVFISVSYIQLIEKCRKSIEGRYKFMQTCMPHLLVLFNMIVASLFDALYSRYGSASFPQRVRNFLALEFLYIPPILNPIIYGLKLTKIRKKVIGLISSNNAVA
ncbi:olfactory receptor 52D1-like [Brachyhypopomus gauderio]|uniref:olfactory receptor 52D1-like n=1 Tax=Brachyhypopomus gauderio TaxID=698409 RepID=UPI004042CBA9